VLRIANQPVLGSMGAATEYLHYMPQIENHVTPTPTITIPPLPDLYPDYYHVQYYGCPWESPGRIVVPVRNGGQADAGHFAVDINHVRTTMEGVAAGTIRDASIDFDQGPVAGIEAWVDSAFEVQESNEGNNFIPLLLFTPPPPCP